MKTPKLLILIIAALLIFPACKVKKEIVVEEEVVESENISAPVESNVTIPAPPIIVYKTKKNYNKNVPVTLNNDKTKVVGFPDPTDLMINGEYAYPLQLQNGYLFDKKGISLNTAFLKISYEEYAAMETPMGPEKLFLLVIDKDPIVEMYNCGIPTRYINLISELNEIIRYGDMEKKWDKLK